jgi:hypothetical protein
VFEILRTLIVFAQELHILDWFGLSSASPAISGGTAICISLPRSPSEALRVIDTWGDYSIVGIPPCSHMVFLPPYITSFQTSRGIGVENLFKPMLSHARNVFVQPPYSF